MKKALAACILALILILSSTGVVAANPPPDVPLVGPPQLQKIVFIHYDRNVKPDNPGKPGGGANPEDYYKLSGLKLPDDVISYEINGEMSEYVGTIVASFETWDAVIPGDKFTATGTTNLVGGYRDGHNVVSWGELNTGIIAQTTMWYFPIGRPMPIVEFDIVFNHMLSWGIDPDGEGTASSITGFDMQNIATHEVGHPVGLADVYKNIYYTLTMYGYGSLGETQKQSLAPGDIKGAQALYGTVQ